MCVSRPCRLFGLAAPLLLMQLTPTSCLQGGTGGGTTSFNLPPTVVMTSDVDRGVAPLTVFFNSSSSTDDGVIIRRDWDLGDGVGTSQEISPTYTYTNTGTYTVRLTITDDQGLSASSTLTIFVTQRPVAIIEVDRTTAPSAPAVFQFDGSKSFDPDAGPGETLLYQWDFGDGSRELLAVVAHTYASSGTYRVRLTVTDAVGVTGTAERIIAVGIPMPSISFRSPPSSVNNIVAPPSASLWVHAVYEVEPGVPRTIRAGLDGDHDICNGEVALFDAQTGVQQRILSDWSNDPDVDQGAVRAAVFSPVPNSDLLLAGGDDGTTRLYDTVGGSLLRRFSGPGSEIRALAFAPDGASFAIGYSDGTLLLRKTDGDVVIRALHGHTAAINAVAISFDGSQLISGDEAGLAILWNLSDGTEALRLDHQGQAVTGVAFSPIDPQRVLTGCADATARLWSTVNGALTEEFAPVFSGGRRIAGHAGGITAVAFSPDGTLLATASSDKTAKLWNVAAGSELRTLKGHTDALTSVGFSPDSKQLITGSVDHTALLWDVASGRRLRTLEPCSSTVTAVGFAPDGKSVQVAVAAQNDIQLDTSPSSGEDLNLTVPTALRLRNVPTGDQGREYFLWAEVRTDRTQPARTYSQARVNVVPEFTQTISDATPLIPLRNDAASVVVPPTQQRQIFDLGQLDVGDRLILSLLSLPGYGQTYSQTGLNPLELSTSTSGGYSLLVLDADEKMFAWYDAGRVLFTPDARLIIGHASTGYFVVLDATGGELVPSVNVRIARQAADTSEPRQQYVYLNFDGSAGLAVGASSLFRVAPFSELSGFNANDISTMRTAIVARVGDLLGDYNVVVSDSPPASSTTPQLTIYFDVEGQLLHAEIPDRNHDSTITTADLYFWGLPDYFDVRNANLSGRAVVAVKDLVEDPANAALAAGQLGLAIGNAAAHQVGLLTGLRETTEPMGLVTDVMTADAAHVADPALSFTTADLAPLDDLDPIGIQDAPQLLTELFGPK